MLPTVLADAEDTSLRDRNRSLQFYLPEGNCRALEFFFKGLMIKTAYRNSAADCRHCGDDTHGDANQTSRGLASCAISRLGALRDKRM
jgi:hypothetical protein